MLHLVEIITFFKKNQQDFSTKFLDALYLKRTKCEKVQVFQMITVENLLKEPCVY